MKKEITGKVVYSERGDPGDKEYAGLLGLVRRVVLPRIDGFVFQTHGAQSYFSDSVINRSVVIPNPVFVHADDFSAVKERRKVIVTIGRLHPQKNQKLLVEAFSRIADLIPEYSLEIYGEGELQDDLLLQIKNLSLTDRVFLMGTSSKVLDLIHDASIFVLSSDYEGLPNTLLEAMALGLPCISTDCKPGGAREIIDDGIDGIIVPCNSADCLSKAILDLATNENVRSSFGYAAKKRSGNYDARIIYSMWDLFFENLLAGPYRPDYPKPL